MILELALLILVGVGALGFRRLAVSSGQSERRVIPGRMWPSDGTA